MKWRHVKKFRVLSRVFSDFYLLVKLTWYKKDESFVVKNCVNFTDVPLNSEAIFPVQNEREMAEETAAQFESFCPKQQHIPRTLWTDLQLKRISFIITDKNLVEPVSPIREQ